MSQENHDLVMRLLTNAATKLRPPLTWLLDVMGTGVKAYGPDLSDDMAAIYRAGIANVAWFGAECDAVKRSVPAALEQRWQNLELRLVGDFMAGCLQGRSNLVEQAVEAGKAELEKAKKFIEDREAEAARQAEWTRRNQIEIDVVSMSAAQIITEAEKAAGVRIELDGSAIRVQPAGRLGSPHLERIALKKPAIAAFLAERQAVQVV